MTKNPTSEVSRELNVRADMTITKDDLVAIRIAEVERALHEQKLAVIERRRTAETSLKKAVEEHCKAYRDVAYEAAGTRFDAAIAALNALIRSSDTFSVTAILRFDERTKARHSVCAIEGISSTELQISLTAAQNRRIQSVEDAVKDQENEIKSCEDAMLEIKRKIADLPMLERQAKAAVATAVMGAGDGKTLLDIVNGVSLPGLTYKPKR